MSNEELWILSGVVIGLLIVGGLGIIIFIKQMGNKNDK